MMSYDESNLTIQKGYTDWVTYIARPYHAKVLEIPIEIDNF